MFFSSMHLMWEQEYEDCLDAFTVPTEKRGSEEVRKKHCLNIWKWPFVSS